MSKVRLAVGLWRLDATPYVSKLQAINAGGGQSMTIYDEIEEASRASSQWLKLAPGEKTILKFDQSKIKLVDATFNGKTKKRVRYEVVNVNKPLEVKSFEISISHATQLNALLQRGYLVVEVTRLGAGMDTRYSFVPGA